MWLKKVWQDLEKREIALIVFTGLVVTYVRHGLHYHWKVWDSWEEFFLSWFINTIAVVVLVGASMAAIIYLHRFFLDTKERIWA